MSESFETHKIKGAGMEFQQITKSSAFGIFTPFYVTFSVIVLLLISVVIYCRLYNLVLALIFFWFTMSFIIVFVMIMALFKNPNLLMSESHIQEMRKIELYGNKDLGSLSNQELAEPVTEDKND